MIQSADDLFRTRGLSVEPRGRKVVIELAEQQVELTPREAQTFAYFLARAYARAGGLQRVGPGHGRLTVAD